jgi:hypothetical protein
VVVDIGQTTENEPAEAPTGQQLAVLFGEMTKSNGMTRRQAIAAISRRYSIPANAVYAALERTKK